METTAKKRVAPCIIIRVVLLIIVLLAGLFWTWFGVGSGIFEGIGFVGTIMHSLIPGVLLIVLSLLAMRWPLFGGLLLIAAGVFYTYFFHVSKFFVALVLIAPPVIAGLWAFISAITCRPKRAPAPKETR